ncbi:MAG: DMT family transporter [Prevotellaceae bacterium]|jgi:transporter family protein|nr:DMT family transporter [Prevotellaceae bacterium]
MWIYLALASALLLGFYDVSKKVSLRGNAVLPVLYVAAFFSAMLFVPFIILSKVSPALDHFLYIQEMTWEQHLFTFVKSCIVGSSWVLSYYAMRYLPITIVSPIRATAPLFTLLGAATVLGERLEPMQWMGVFVTVAFFWRFSKMGRMEKVNFWGNKWMYCLYLGTMLGAVSGLYDKYLISHLGMPKNAVQAWYSLYMLLVLLPIALLKWWPNRRENKFVFRWSIALIGVCLALSDFTYFYSLSIPESLVAVVSALRRCSVVVPFLVGVIFLNERRNVLRKLLIICGMLIGVAMIALGS